MTGAGGWLDRAIAHLEAQLAETIEDIVSICEIPAPTFRERRRAMELARRLNALGLSDVHLDGVGNVIGRYPLRASGSRNGALVVSAHLDTVFPDETPIKVRRTGDRLEGPGVGDNSTSLAVLVRVVAALLAAGWESPVDLVVLANVGEEGLGDLRGMKGFFDGYAAENRLNVRGCLVLDGPLGNLSNRGIGSRRLDVTFTGPGGHSWKDFGTPSAIHALGRAIAVVADLTVPRRPKTTYNVGLVRGGTSVNTIAAEAGMVVDLRSEQEEALDRLEARVRRAVSAAAGEGTGVRIEVVGDRPIGAIPDQHPLVQAARDAARGLGLALRCGSSSTDANVPLSRGIPACALGVYRGGGAHTRQEYVLTGSLPDGMKLALLTLVGWAAWAAAESERSG